MPFDKTAYQREYMRKRRAAAQKAAPVKPLRKPMTFAQGVEAIYLHIKKNPGAVAGAVLAALNMDADLFVNVVLALEAGGQIRVDRENNHCLYLTA